MDKNTYKGLGRRKTSVANVLLNKDSKKVTVNGIDISKYLTPLMSTRALLPLTLTSQSDVYGVKIKVSGGGKQAQAEAISLGIARALLKINEEWRKQLKAAGMLTRDPRSRERKKPGLKRARRAPQFSKR
jgi:small subunit ribosomal protein S9